jgi:uncharacterized membrane protein
VWMIAWHTADAWLAAPLRGTAAFRLVELIGGLAAPWFFLLAGVAAGLTEPEGTERRRAALGAGLRRAGQIAVLGYALKLFGLAVDRGGLVDARAPAIVLGALGLAALHEALGALPWLPARWRGGAGRGLMGAAGLAGFAGAVAWLRGDAVASELVLRLDVLQGIGAALAVLAGVLALPVRGSARLALPATLAIAVALATPLVAAHGGAPPTHLARLIDYVARLPPYPAASGARFPLLPWLAYMLLGAAIGRALVGRRVERDFDLPRAAGARRGPIAHAGATALVAAGLAASAFEAGPFAQALLTRTELVRNLVRLGYNAGLATFAAALIALLARRNEEPARVLALLGRHSLVVYAAHLEIAYGLAGVPLARALDWGTWWVGAAILALAMVALARGIEARGSANTSALRSQA